jgi:hypothetical protein
LAQKIYKFYSRPFLIPLNPSSPIILIRYMAYIKARNIFPLSKIIFNPSLVLSLHVALLGLIFTNNIFLALSLILAKRISELNIQPSYKQLPLYLKPEMANILVFYKSIKTPYKWQISLNQPLLYTTLLK